MLCGECGKTFRLSEGDLQDFLHLLSCAKKRAELPVSNQTEESPAVTSNNAPVEAVLCSRNEDKQSENFEPLSKRHKPSSSPLGSCDLTCCPKVSCVACLGILEQEYLGHLSSIITEHIHRKSLVGMETYCLSIHVPLSLSIRRIGMEMCAVKCSLRKPIRTQSHDPTTETTEHTTAPQDPATLSGDRISENNYAKEGLKWRLKQLLDASLAPLRWNCDSPLMICLSLEHPSSLGDCIGVKKLRPKLFPRPKKRWRCKYQPTPINRLPVEKALDDITDADMVVEGYFLSPITSPCSHTVEIQHKSVFVAGRYNKYSRELPQTMWIVDGMRKADTSVQELIGPLITEAFRASEERFSSSGREDVDVLMLGNGRPFLLELVNPLNVSISNADLQKIEETINTGTKLIAVKQLRRVGRDSSMLLKQGEEEKRKIYSALVWTGGEMTQERLKILDDSTNLVLKQKTPIRVLHRRSLAVREKVVYSMTTKLLDPHHFRLHLTTQAGTYIKEFVHGDFGRTQPHVRTLLGCEADILSLDVLEVQLDWPPIE